MEINTKIQQFSNKFRELKQCQFPIIKRTIIAELRKLAAEAEVIMQMKQCAENSKRRRQIEDILKKCLLIQSQIQSNPERSSVYNGRKAVNNNGTQKNELDTKKAVRSVIMYTIRSSELKISPAQIDEIAKKMENNLEVMKQIQEMVEEQGENLQKLDEYLQKADQNVQDANVQLDQAKQIQHKTRMLKLKVAVTGFFAGLGYKIFGLPGLVFGMLFGYKSSS